MIASDNLVLDPQPPVNTTIDHKLYYGNVPFSGSVVVRLFYETDLSDQAKSFIARLNSFRNLTNNWDSYGAEPPSRATIDRAIDLVKKADRNSLPVYFVAPGPNGEVVVEFKTGAREASVYFNPDNTTELLVREGDHYLFEGSLEQHYNHLLSLING